MSATPTAQEGLAALEVCDHADLSARWQSLIGRPPPKAASRMFLMRALAYEVQAQHAPGLSKADQKVLAVAAQQACPRHGSSQTSVAEPASSKPRVALVPGARLVREWNGKTYTVSVIEEGFVYKDKIWRSLSAIARDITGAHWSGPRFFGLHKATP